MMRIDSRLELRFSKVVRGLVKSCLPYGLMRWWLGNYRNIKLDEPLLHYPGFFKRVRRTVKFLLPCFLIGNYWRVMRSALGGEPAEESVPDVSREPRSEGTDAKRNPKSFISCADMFRHAAAEGFAAEGVEYLSEEADSDLVLLVSHEASLTGAPIVLLQLAVEFKRRGKTVVVISLIDGPLRKRIVSCGFGYLVVDRSKCPDFVFRARDIASLVVANTLETVDVVVRLNGLAAPVFWWIHEAYASYYEAILMRLPPELQENVHVYCVGRYAKGELLRRRPDYRARELLYGVTDDAEDGVGEAAPPVLPSLPGKKVLACVGTFCERKAQTTLLSAIRRMSPAERNRIAVVFVGCGLDKDILRRVREAEADFPETVRHIESVEPQRMSALYREIDGLVCPSFDDPMPLVVTEALQQGVIAICSENIGSRRLPHIEKSAFWYADNDPEELRGRIRAFLEADASTLAKMRECGRRIYEDHFSPKAFAKRIDEVLAEIESDRCGLTPCDGGVSVVIPTYQAGGEFRQVLAALRRQRSVPPIELVVVDSGSTDETLATAEEFGARVVKIPHEAFSHSSARNLGVRTATGRYVVLMTQDAVPVGGLWLLKLLQPLVRGEAVAASCRQVPKSACTLYGRLCNKTHHDFMDFSEDRICVMPADTSYGSLRRAAQLDDVACALLRSIAVEFPYRGDYAEDLDLGLRLLRAGHRLALLSGVCVAHSHNRTPHYHFRRGIVDILAFKRLFPDFSADSASEILTVSRFVTALVLVSGIAWEVRGTNAATGAAALDALQRALSRIRESVRRDFANARGLLARAGVDRDLERIAGDLLDQYAGEVVFSPEWADSAVSALVTHVPICLKEESYVPAEGWGEEVSRCLVEEFGAMAGSCFGAYATTHGGEDSPLIRLIERNKSGV